MDKIRGLGLQYELMGRAQAEERVEFSCEGIDDYADCIGEVIVSATLGSAPDDARGDEALVLKLESGDTLYVYDDAQCCCESRYMSCDDDVTSLVGAQLAGIEAREMDDAPEEEGRYGDHERQCVIVQTTRGFITLVTHNEHNGYYGGFDLTIRREKA